MFWTRLNNDGLIVAILKSYMGILGGLFLIHIQINTLSKLPLQTLTSDKIRERRGYLLLPWVTVEK
jgi:uncharacterized membrane protein YkgB